MILNQKVIPRWLEVVSCGNRIRRSLLMPESEPKEFKEEREFESVCVFLFFFFLCLKMFSKIFSNETRGTQELKCGAKVMKGKLFGKRNLKLKINMKFSLSFLCMPLKFRALLWWTRILTIGMQN